MNPFDSIIGHSSGGPDESLDDPGTFDVDRLPDPGPFLADARLLTGDDHLTVQRLVREAFEERGVYDATFGYNLAALNRDRRHPDAGLRYGVAAVDGSTAADGSRGGTGAIGRGESGAPGADESGAPGVEQSTTVPDPAVGADGVELRVEFTPTTPFCPQGESLARGAFAALNGLDDRHDYAVVRVRLRNHRAADPVNDDLRERAVRYLETGDLSGADVHDGEQSTTRRA